MGKLKPQKYDIKTFQQWIYESTQAHQVWHKESWEDCAFRDGAHWTAADRTALIAKDIIPITANRIFPVINLMYGFQANNQNDIVAKGRTQMDSEISQVMSESIAYVMDQCDGRAQLLQKFHEQIVPGFGFLKVDIDDDPRREPVVLRSYPWYTFGWDIYGDPWLTPGRCRYAYYYDWVDLDDVISTWPEFTKELEGEFQRMGETSVRGMGRYSTLDIGEELEDLRKEMTGGSWCDTARRRVRPVELYYTVRKQVLFCKMMDGSAFEVKDGLSVNEQFDLVSRSKECFKANVVKVRRANILGNLIMEDIESPHPHDMFPYVPFIGYLDRFNLPFGVPRQLKEQAKEVNKRRSMALALLGSKRMTIEEGAVEDPDVAFAEMNKRTGMVVVRENKLDRVKIEDLSDLADSQIDMMNISEREIKEISGANDESLGYPTKVMSGTALEKKQNQSGIMTASLTNNHERSKKRLGELVMAEIQGEWTGPKVLRVTDRMTGADRFVELNQEITDAGGNVIEIRNNIVNGRFDCVVASRPMSDTIREQYVELAFAAIQKATPEMVPELMSVAFELSDLPFKDMLLARLRSVSGVEPIDSMLSKAEQEQKQQQKQAAIEEKSNADAQFLAQERELSLQEREAKIAKERAEVEALVIELKNKEREMAGKEFEMGYRLQQDILKQRETRKPGEAR